MKIMFVNEEGRPELTEDLNQEYVLETAYLIFGSCPNEVVTDITEKSFCIVSHIENPKFEPEELLVALNELDDLATSLNIERTIETFLALVQSIKRDYSKEIIQFLEEDFYVV